MLDPAKRQSVDERLDALGSVPEEIERIIERYAGSGALSATQADPLLNALYERLPPMAAAAPGGSRQASAPPPPPPAAFAVAAAPAPRRWFSDEDDEAEPAFGTAERSVPRLGDAVSSPPRFDAFGSAGPRFGDSAAPAGSAPRFGEAAGAGPRFGAAPASDEGDPRAWRPSDAAPEFAPETETDGPPMQRMDARLARQSSHPSGRRDTPFPGGLAGADDMPDVVRRVPNARVPNFFLPVSRTPLPAAPLAARDTEVSEQSAAIPRLAHDDGFEILVDDDELLELEPDEIEIDASDDDAS